MSELITTRQLQEILQVDRTTIYRMAESGRIPAVKVGNQWRFPREQVDHWLRSQNTPLPADSMRSADADANVRQLLPLECVQLIQDAFADALGVMILITDLSGQPVTRPSNPCGLFSAAEASPVFHQRCVELWSQLANDPALSPRFLKSHIGLLCTRGLIRIGNELRAMLVVGGIAPPVWPPSEAEVQRIAADLDLDPELIWKHIDEVRRLDAAEQARVLVFVQRIADVMSHIAGERKDLLARLQRIAQLADLQAGGSELLFKD